MHWLPLGQAESHDPLLLIVQIHAHLLSHVEDGTISVGADHLLVQGFLASLALRPQAREGLLQFPFRPHLLLIKLTHPGLAMWTQTASQ